MSFFKVGTLSTIKGITLRIYYVFFLISALLKVTSFRFYDWVSWVKRDFGPPSPAALKRLLLHRLGGRGVWIESGTFKGETTEFLSRYSQMVFSIEPSLELFEKATKRFLKTNNVEVIHGLSENSLAELLDGLTPSQMSDVSFWLDGHYSEGVTFKGPSDTPILIELEIISASIHRFNRLAIFIDDMRCFDSSDETYKTYPSKNQLVNWAIENELVWTVEHDIFIAKNY